MTCEGYKEAGITKSDWYEIDPDGTEFGEAPITAYCNFSAGN